MRKVERLAFFHLYWKRKIPGHEQLHIVDEPGYSFVLKWYYIEIQNAAVLKAITKLHHNCICNHI